MGHRHWSWIARIAFVGVTALAVVPSPAIAAPAGTDDGVWQQLAPPPWLIWHTSIYDPVRDRMILFAGFDGLTRQAELWELSFSGDPEWRLLRTAGAAPPPLSFHGAVYDPLRDRMLVIGGSLSSGATPVRSNQVWALSLSGDPQWSLVAATGVPPVPRTCREIVYDSIADRVLLFGGTTATGQQNDLWSLSLAGTPAWSPLTPAGIPPSPRSISSFVFDPVRNRVLVFGGSSTTAYVDETWELALTGSPEWRLLSTSGARPAGRNGHSAFYDPEGDRMIILNGATLVDGDPVGLQDAWCLSLGPDPVWSPLAASGLAAPGGSGGSVVYDSNRRRAVCYGGWVGNTSSVSQTVWVLTLDSAPTWSKIAEPQGPKATGRRGHSAVFDPVRHRMIVFGGLINWVGEPSPLVNDLWALDLDPPYAWTPIQASGTPPAARWGHAAVYDPIRDRMIVFGGAGASRLGDLWELTLSPAPAWHPLAATGIPPAARTQHTAIYDPVGDRMLVFGGLTVNYTADVWELSLGSTPTWHLMPVIGPGPRAGHTAVHDPAGARMIVFGGYNGTVFGDLWALELAGTPHWTPLTPGGPPPAGRQYHVAVCDPRRQRMLLLGGLGQGDVMLGDLVELRLDGTPQWRNLVASDAPLPQFGLSAIYDPTRDGMWTYGGTGSGNNVVRAYWPSGGPTTPVWVEDFALTAMDGGVEIRWRTAEPARTEEFRLAGSDAATSWTVPIAMSEGRSFVGEDRFAPDQGSGDRQYTLAWNDPSRGWVVLAEKTWSRGDRVAPVLLLAPRPNPARGQVEIPFVLGGPQPIQVVIEDVAGRVVRQLRAASMPAGTRRLSWNGDDSNGRKVASGVYFVRLVTRGGAQTRKLVIAR